MATSSMISSLITLLLLHAAPLSLSQIVYPPFDSFSPCICGPDTDGDGTTIKMDCNSNGLNDSRISDTLDAFLAPGISPLSWADLSFNSFTELPTQLSKLTRLNYILLEGNRINSVPTGAFNFATPLRQLSLYRNQLATIESNAFPGNYGRGSTIDLRLNRLTRFESSVFLPILQQMAPYPGTVIDQTYVSINLNPFDCEGDPCHLAWLIRDNNNLLKNVRGGSCSNGTTFEELDPNGYSSCPPTA